MRRLTHRIFFFFNDTATTEIYTLSLHDALPISPRPRPRAFLYESALLRGMHRRSQGAPYPWLAEESQRRHPHRDRKSTRLNSSHLVISYAVFCLKKKKYQDGETSLSLRCLPAYT